MPPNMVSPGFAYPASRVTPGTLDWPVIGTEVNDDWWRENSSIQNRSWHLYRTNPYALAMVQTMLEGGLGADGLLPRSIYATDEDRLRVGDVDTTATDAMSDTRVARMLIEQELKKAYAGKNLDAGGQLSKKDMSVTAAISMMVTGDAIAIRSWKPNRPGNPYTATCWRVIDPSRVSNPNWGYNTAEQYEGLKLNPDGIPIGMWVQRRSPYAVQVVDYQWDYIPWYAPDGQLNIIHMKAPGRPDQMRGFGWFAPIMGLINQLGNVTDAYVAAKRVQACIGMIVQVADPQSSATADAQTAKAQGAARLYPGMVRYERESTKITTLNWNFNGSDHSAFQDSMLQPISAAWGLPLEVVQHRLAKANLAASRAALMAYYRTCCSFQKMMIEGFEQPIAESVLIEGIARRRLPVEDISDAKALMWKGPPQAFPDPVREATADELRRGEGMSLSSIFARQGMDFEKEILQRSQDEAFAKAHGVSLTLTSGAGSFAQPDPNDKTDTPDVDTGTDTDGAPDTVDGEAIGA